MSGDRWDHEDQRLRENHRRVIHRVSHPVSSSTGGALELSVSAYHSHSSMLRNNISLVHEWARVYSRRSRDPWSVRDRVILRHGSRGQWGNVRNRDDYCVQTDHGESSLSGVIWKSQCFLSSLWLSRRVPETFLLSGYCIDLFHALTGRYSLQTMKGR